MTRAEELIAQAAQLIEEARELSTPITRDDLKTMTPQQIVQAKADGRLDNILKGTK